MTDPTDHGAAVGLLTFGWASIKVARLQSRFSECTWQTTSAKSLAWVISEGSRKRVKQLIGFIEVLQGSRNMEEPPSPECAATVGSDNGQQPFRDGIGMDGQR